ncbi:tetratricopeptide repeat protein [Shewanella sp.]|uniref:tetratricopeptide repeat protein n=1 Tax=Shewanella sp. TaxID=50422 RepID=UPI0035658F96
MSVINQMLKDLDKRQQGHGVQQLPRAVAVQPGRQRSSVLVWLMLLLLVFIATAAYIAMQFQQAQPTGTGAAPQAQIGVPPANVSEAAAISLGTGDENLNKPSAPQIETDAAPESPLPEVSSTVSAVPAAGNNQNPVNNSAPEQTSQLTGAATKEPAVSSPVRSSSPTVESKPQSHMAVTEVRLSIAERAERAMIKAANAEHAGKLTEAAEHYGEALSLEPARHQARRQLAALRYGQGRMSDAILVLETGKSRFPDEYSFSLLLAKLWREQGDRQQSLTLLSDIPDGSPLAADKWLLQADIARESQDYPLAEQAYRQLLISDSERSTWRLGLAYALDTQGRFIEAGEHYRRALRGQELSADARRFVESRLMQLGEHQ